MIKIDRQLMWRKSNKHRSVGWCTSTSDRTTYLARRRLPPSINNFFRLCCPMGRRAGRQVEDGGEKKINEHFVKKRRPKRLETRERGRKAIFAFVVELSSRKQSKPKGTIKGGFSKGCVMSPADSKYWIVNSARNAYPKGCQCEVASSGWLRFAPKQYSFEPRS